MEPQTTVSRQQETTASHAQIQLIRDSTLSQPNLVSSKKFQTSQLDNFSLVRNRAHEIRRTSIYFGPL